MERKLPLPIGSTDYKKICEQYYYVDKTLFIKEILDESAVISLFTRPRRFGKTLNMDMLRTFFEKTELDTSKYFTNKQIWQQGEEYRKHQGKYPVIFLCLKDIKADNWSTAFKLLKMAISLEFLRHSELKNSTKLSPQSIAFYKKIVNGEADETDYMVSFKLLSQMLHEHYDMQAIVIIDEYDTPIQEGYIKGFYAEAAQFTINFFSSALKDNPHICFGFLTGILRVAKESIFSGLNNINVNSVLDRRYSDYFGFTTEEVQKMAEYYNASAKMPEIKAWYDGYRFGNTEIFNPWSVIKYFNNYCQAEPYWVQTSENSTIREILKNVDTATTKSLRELLNGAAVDSIIETDIIYPTLRDSQTNIFGFLLMTGYLKSVKTIKDSSICLCTLSIPNKEVQSVYCREILALLSNDIGNSSINQVKQFLITKDIVGLQEALQKFLLETISYYDTLKESYYQGLLLGITGLLNDDYYITSNRESGEGRYDIQLKPKNIVLPGVLIEIKATKNADKEAMNKLAEKALEQIDEKKYDIELKQNGVTNILKYGVVFCGKRVHVAAR